MQERTDHGKSEFLKQQFIEIKNTYTVMPLPKDLEALDLQQHVATEHVFFDPKTSFGHHGLIENDTSRPIANLTKPVVTPRVGTSYLITNELVNVRWWSGKKRMQTQHQAIVARIKTTRPMFPLKGQQALIWFTEKCV